MAVNDLLTLSEMLVPDAGSYKEVAGDILSVRLLHPDYCAILVDILAGYQSETFKPCENDRYGGQELRCSRISPFFCWRFWKAFDKHVFPAMAKHWHWHEQTSIINAEPFATRYSMETQRNLDQHFDCSFTSMNIKLNDDYEGADLVFLGRPFDYKAVPVGNAIVWPSLVAHQHYVDSLLSGVAYRLNMWNQVHGPGSQLIPSHTLYQVNDEHSFGAAMHESPRRSESE